MDKLFSPFQLGRCKLEHRVVHAPMTRLHGGRTSHVDLTSGTPAVAPSFAPCAA